MTVSGYAAIDDCSAGPGACYVNCGTVCDYNQYQMAWPNFYECIDQYGNQVYCQKNTSLPFYSGCGYNGPNLSCPCGNSVTPFLQECGPPARYTSGGYCPQGSQLVICCVNTLTFKTLCNGCNPMLGIVYVNAG